MTSSFPRHSNALSPPSASERGSPPLRFPLAPIVASSRDDARTVVRVRYLSKALATVRFLPGTGGTFFRGIMNWFRVLPGRSFGTLHQLRQKSSGVLSVSASPGPFVDALLHAANKAWRRKHDVQRNTASGA